MGRLIFATTSRTNSSISTQDNRLAFRSTREMTTDRTQLPMLETLKKKTNCLKDMTPMSMACRQLMVAVRKMVKVQVAVACSGLSLSCRYMGTRKMPPPSPNPLKTPAMKLFCMISVLFYSIMFSRSKRDSPSVRDWAVHSSSCCLFQRQKQAAIPSTANYKLQYTTEQGDTPIRLGNFSEPLRSAMATQPAMSNPMRLNILTLSSFWKGLTALSLIASLCLQFSNRIRLSSVYFRCPSTKRWYILGREQVATEMMMVAMAALGSSLLSMTPRTEPMNMTGRVTKAYSYLMTGSLLKAFCIWFIMFPQEAPRMQAKTTIVASFGIRSKQRMSITRLGPPPPRPARLARPPTTAMMRQPMMCWREMMGSVFYWLASRQLAIWCWREQEKSM